MTSEETAVGGRFRTTLWTVVLTAKDPGSPQRREALETLIRTYWKPLYSFIRRRGNDPESSKDITQGFFTALLEKNFLQDVDPDKGKFRTFLLAAFRHYSADQFDRASAQKRGGSRLQLDFEQAEAEGMVARGSSESPDQLFLREWALQVLAQAIQALKSEYEEAGRADEFDAIRLNLSYGASGAPSYGELAGRLGLSENDVRNRVHRARSRLRESILGVLRSCSESERDAQDELRDLFSAFLQIGRA